MTVPGLVADVGKRSSSRTRVCPSGVEPVPLEKPKNPISVPVAALLLGFPLLAVGGLVRSRGPLGEGRTWMNDCRGSQIERFLASWRCPDYVLNVFGPTPNGPPTMRTHPVHIGTNVHPPSYRWKDMAGRLDVRSPASSASWSPISLAQSSSSRPYARWRASSPGCLSSYSSSFRLSTA
jgi:hypothetical protein